MWGFWRAAETTPHSTEALKRVRPSGLIVQSHDTDFGRVGLFTFPNLVSGPVPLRGISVNLTFAAGDCAVPRQAGGRSDSSGGAYGPRGGWGSRRRGFRAVGIRFHASGWVDAGS